MAAIAVFGGTFNPIHNGHINLVSSFIKRMNFDRVLLIPTKIPPHKATLDLVSGEHRLNMIKAAVRDIPKLEACDIELKRERTSYTVDTLRQLKEQYPSDTLYLIVGSDMFLTLDTWKNASEIFNTAVICSAARDFGDYEKMIKKAESYKKYGAECEIMNFDILKLSSTDVRKAVI